jgi:exosortase A-associated hydrolase 1
MREDAVTFACGGEQLVGVVAQPDATASLGVLILAGGPQYRVGSHRQFLLLAARLAEAGIAVMRFDYRGMGDSSGPVQPFEETAPDIAAALNAFMSSCPRLERIVLWGLCDGASAALLYWEATRDPRVAGMVLLNPWVFSNEDAFARSQVRHHYRRLLQRDFWMQVGRGEFDVIGALRWFVSRLLTAGAASSRTRSEPNFQDRMIAAMEKFSGPVLLVLSGSDVTGKAFLGLCVTSSTWSELARRPNVEQASLPGADHTFSDTALRQKVEALNLEWLRRSFF